MVSELNVSALMRIDIDVIWVVEEKWLVESTSISANVSHFTVEISNQTHSVVHGIQEYLLICNTTFINSFKGIWLLRDSISAVMVSCEGLECSDSVPSSTDFFRNISMVTTDIGSCEWSTCNVSLHDRENGEAHVFGSREVISESS